MRNHSFSAKPAAAYRRVWIFLCVMGLAPAFIAAASLEGEHVSVKTPDGVVLKGVFQKPTAGKGTVVLLHGLASWKGEWAPLTQELTRKGYGWLAFDARGHGESSLTRNKNGGPDGYRAFGPPGRGSPWERMINDVGAILRFLETKKGVARKEIVLAGASLGANVALNYAALTGLPGGLILLSPGDNYQGIKMRGPLKKVKGIPTLMVVSPHDSYAYRSVQSLKNFPSSVEVWSDVKPGHGVQMFDPVLLERLLQWLERRP